MSRPDQLARQYPSVLVIGAGELGKAVLYALADNPRYSAISVLLRPSTIHGAKEQQSQPGVNHGSKVSDAIGFQKLGIKLVPGDYIADTEESLTTTFRSYHTVIGCSGYAHGAAGVQPKLTRAVLAAGVPRYIPWQFGVDYDVLGQGSSQDLFDEQLEVRRLLRAQTATPWIIVQVGMFQSYLLDHAEFGILDTANRAVRALGSWETEITVTAAQDIGKVVAEILLEQPEIRDTVVKVAGDTLSYGQLADLVDKHLGGDSVQYKRELWNLEHLKRDLAEDPDNGLKKYRPIFASHEGIAWSKEDSWNARHGLEMQTIEQELSDRSKLAAPRT